jgi:hypothetical protein
MLTVVVPVASSVSSTRAVAMTALLVSATRPRSDPFVIAVCAAKNCGKLKARINVNRMCRILVMNVDSKTFIISKGIVKEL